MALPHHCELGESGENLACDELRRQGYAILDRRYRTRAGEIDIVARDGSALVFVEVKTRRSARFGGPHDALTHAKRQRVTTMAADWLARHRIRASSCRFDVVGVTVADGRPAVTLVRGAFIVGE
jgi:putative endonuclease